MGEINDIIGSERRDFENKALEVSDLMIEPLEEFKVWLERALSGIVKEPYAMTLSTIAADGYPSSRVVFLRGIQTDGLVFYTNYESLKGAELSMNEHAALNFHWADQDRQVRVKGNVRRVDDKISDAYFSQRPRASQLGAWASSQSKVLDSREALERRIEELTEEYKDKSVPRPAHWGGFVLTPKEWEFWQGRKSRLHDRFRYTPGQDAWHIDRLYP